MCYQMLEDGVRSFSPMAIAISGGAGSGKSTLASALSQVTGWVTVSFGQYVRYVAEKERIEPTRENLQVLGVSLTEQGWRTFTECVLEHFGWRPADGVVVEGVRHLEIFEALRDIIYPLPIAWIFLDTPVEVRSHRQKSRGDAKVHTGLGHSTEAQMERIKETAKYLIDGSLSREDVLHKALSLLSRDLAL